MAISETGVVQSERRWALAMAVVSVIFLTAILYAAIAQHLSPPSNVELIDPATIHVSGEFAEDNLGTRLEPEGGVVIRLVTTQFSFVPSCVVVPQDAPVTFRVVSPDVIHGIMVVGTNVNTMIVPGYISRVRTRFAEAGEKLMPCHEFCGLGHSQMIAKVRVVPVNEFKPDADGRAHCAEP
ncbi:MAG: cytochrome C oxidase subunit II [Proteobacteria bacterium]|nr:cytochrome C oxidase subunit II [Pseudomonadota bacterium]